MYDFSETPKREVRPHRQVKSAPAKQQTHSIKDVAYAVLLGGLLTGIIPAVAIGFIGAVA